MPSRSTRRFPRRSSCRSPYGRPTCLFRTGGHRRHHDLGKAGRAACCLPERCSRERVGNPVLAFWLIAMSGLSVLCAFAGREDERRVRLANAPIIHHRRYVLPGSDIDAVDRPLWNRAVDAVNQVTKSDVVTRELIDSVQVTTVLPQRLWEIAERLARLAEVRIRQREILAGVSPDDPDIAVAVGRQRRAQDLAAADVERRVHNLEAFAELVARADTATRKEAIVSDLAELDGKHADLLAAVGETEADRDVAERLASDTTAIIEQAREAIRQANEAAINLVLPGDDAAPTREPDSEPEPDGE